MPLSSGRSAPAAIQAQADAIRRRTLIAAVVIWKE
jgi:hypothetical protein